MISIRTKQLRAALKDLERSYDITIEAMGDALDLRDEETEGHSRQRRTRPRTRRRSRSASHYRPRSLSPRHRKDRHAESTLLKPGRLDPDAMAILRDHGRCGYETVRKIPSLREAAEIVHAPQERFDGTGDPRGLSGDQIPLGARIFAIAADTLDAMTSGAPLPEESNF